MDENYINIIRKSLYKNSEKTKTKLSLEMPRKAKRIKFSLDHYNSETVFNSKAASEKIENRKCTPFKKKLSKKNKGVKSLSSDSSLEETSNGLHKLATRKATPYKNNVPKKRRLVLSFSSNDSFEEDVKNNTLTPSKSELEIFDNTFKKSGNKSIAQFKESSESEESISDFDLEAFFNTCEPSVNESITESHCGIDNEFESEYLDDARIVESNLFLNNKNYIENKPEELTNDFIENANNVVEISDDVNSISDDSTEHNVLEVASKVQGTVVLNDDEVTNSIVIPASLELEEENSSENSVEYNAADYYDLGDGQLIILKPSLSICFHGLLTLKVLYGKVDILGNILDKNSNEISLYSPRGSALLKISNISSTETIGEADVSKILSALAISGISDVLMQESALIRCIKLEDKQTLFIEKYISQQIFPTIENHNLPQAIFEPTGTWNVIKESYSWDEVLSNVQSSTKLMLAGGKGVGKSTFLRFAINRLLNKFDKVRVIDLDPGQSEFGVPGCVSIVAVTEPIFGPNFSHLKSAERSLLSNINVGYNPAAYIKCVQSLMTYSQTLEECPTLINYMGFAQGIGLDIVSSAITYIQPTDVVQIHSRSHKKNFKQDLSIEVVEENCKLFGSSSTTLDYNLHIVQAMNDDNDGWTLEPRQAREMCVLAYLSRMMSTGVNSLMSHKLPMFETKLSAIKITNLQGEELSPATVNANLVALCSLEEDTNIFVCLGYGVVRGIDLESDILVLLTPEASSVLEEVSHLVLGSVSLPPSVYMTPDNIKGSIPYVMEGELVSLGQATRRTYLPVNKK